MRAAPRTRTAASSPRPEGIRARPEITCGLLVWRYGRRRHRCAPSGLDVIALEEMRQHGEVVPRLPPSPHFGGDAENAAPEDR
jgi:hypothetical protein